MRFWLSLSMLIPAITVTALMILLYFPLASFRRRYPRLCNEVDLSAFKRLASWQMYGSLMSLILTPVPLIIWVVGKFVLSQLTWLDGFLFVILPFAVQFIVSSAAIPVARAVRATPAATDELTAERDRVVKVWIQNLLPDW